MAKCKLNNKGIQNLSKIRWPSLTTLIIGILYIIYIITILDAMGFNYSCFCP